MKRWYFAASVAVAISCPAAMMAQGNATGGVGLTGGTGTSTRNATGGNASGLAGTANTTLLGNQVDLNFNSVFGSNASLANTYADPFSAYRPSGSGAGSGTGTGGGIGNAFAGGTGMGSGLGGTQRTNTGLGTNSGLGTGGLGGSNANRGGLGGTGLGALGGGGLGAGGLGGGLGGNRAGALGGNTMNLGGNRGVMGGGGFLGGGAGGFLGGGAGSFLGGGANNQQNATAPMGYIVHYDGMNTAGSNAGSAAVAPAGDFQKRLLATPGFQNSQNVQVYTRGETAILQGKVTSDYAKQLAAAMVRLEPGVYEVENKLEVVPNQ